MNEADNIIMNIDIICGACSAPTFTILSSLRASTKNLTIEYKNK